MSRIALIGKNSLGYVEKLISIWNTQNCAVLIDWRIPIKTSVQLMREAGVSKCLLNNSQYKLLQGNLPDDIMFVPFDDECANVMFLSEDIIEQFVPNYSKDEAVIIYSSGTTGKSKGIILSHYAINTNADAIINYLKPNATDCMYMIKTISHSSSLVGELLVAIKSKTKLLIAPTIVPPRYTLKNIEKYRVTKICINPTLLKMYIDEIRRKSYDIHTLREIYVHGAKASKELCIQAKDCFKNANVYFEYGLSEAGPRVSSQKISNSSIDSVGKPIQEVLVTIVDENGIVVSTNQIGVIHVKTSGQYSGYVSGEAKFKSLYNNWLNTGDTGFFDECGELHIVNRIDDVINIDAHKIYPNEIEEAILCLSGINECAVVELENSRMKFLACLYVGKFLADKDIRAHLRAHLPTYEIPQCFVHCHQIPCTINGKRSKTLIKEEIIKRIGMEKTND